MTQRFVTYAFDVGGRENVGWARAVHRGDGLTVKGGRSVQAFVDAMQADIKQGHPLTLGMECPLFIPVPKKASDLNRARKGEGNRPVFAQVGASVAALGVHQLAFILQEIKQTRVTLLLDWKKWKRRSKSILLWEAFVAGDAHSEKGNHVRDAATAATAFTQRSLAGKLTSDVSVERPARVLSLVGCAVLWAGDSKDLRLLRQPVLVVKPTSRWEGAIENC